jgi:CO/xanthine dehydrogenase FAD-binding subunit|tara:strand:- start:695 stop:1579 length:885 start_codon:yes stop_codon:yes gene_type:complete
LKPVAFDYLRPDTVDEVLSVLAENAADAVLLAGGMSLGPMLNMRLVRPSVLIDLNRIKDLDEIRVTDDGIITGATTRQADILKSRVIAEQVPLLTRAMRYVGHFQTRTRGTVGGSVAHADPSAEIPLVLVTLGGKIELASQKNQRRWVAASEFFCGVLTTDRRPDEMLVALHWPRLAPETGYAFEEVAQRPGDLAIAAVACAVKVGSNGKIAELRLGLGGVEDRPFRLDTSAVIGEPADEPTARALSDQAFETVNPIEDMTAGADYRLALVRTLAFEAVGKAFAEAAGKAKKDG